MLSLRLLLILLVLGLAGRAPARPGQDFPDTGTLSSPAGDRLDRLTQKWEEIQKRYPPTSFSGGESRAASVNALLDKARRDFGESQSPSGMQTLDQAERLVFEYLNAAQRQQMARAPGRGPGEPKPHPGSDSVGGHDPRFQDWQFLEQQKAEMALARAEEKYQSAKLKLEGTDSRSLDLLRQMRELLDRARVELDARRPAGALALIGSAESLHPQLWQAAQHQHAQRQMAQEAIRRAEMRHRSLAEQLSSRGKVSDQASRLFAKAVSLLGQAQEELRLGRSESALRQAQRAEEVLNEVARLRPEAASRPDDRPDDRNTEEARLRRFQLERELERARAYLDRFETQGRGGAGHLERLERGLQLLSQGYAFLNKGEEEATRKTLERLHREISSWPRPGLSGSGHSREQILAALQTKIAKARDIVQGSNQGKAADLLNKGIAHYEKARQEKDRDPARFRIEADIALKLVTKAVDIAQSRSGR